MNGDQLESENTNEKLADTKQQPKSDGEKFQSFKTLEIWHIILVIGSLCFFALMCLSAYYKIYLNRQKMPPFNAPSYLRFFFPRPINNEHEIAVLCQKYMNA